MNRRYDSREYFRTTEILRTWFDHPALTTDVIVGFPQETEEEFRETEAFIRKVAFAELHVFKYSRRKGTVAASLQGQLTEAEKSARSRVLIEAGEEMSRTYREYYIGKQAEVLFEDCHQIAGGTYWVGHTPQYVKVAKAAQEGEILSNRIVTGIVEGFLDDEVLLIR
jgi:threonylcarbamoyladenosine tRNA methylthiotransferase MtaB